ncbi:MAG: hypothetical protein AB7U20_11025 [Planctomycetaceae bacterium]
MPDYHVQWTPEAEDHIAEHGVTKQEFEEVVGDPQEEFVSNSTGRHAVRGWTKTGKLLFCVYELDIDHFTLFPVTAYEIGE